MYVVYVWQSWLLDLAHLGHTLLCFNSVPNISFTTFNYTVWNPLAFTKIPYETSIFVTCTFKYLKAFVTSVLSDCWPRPKISKLFFLNLPLINTVNVFVTFFHEFRIYDFFSQLCSYFLLLRLKILSITIYFHKKKQFAATVKENKKILEKKNT